MYAILAEDDSDADVLKRIIKRHLGNDRLKIKAKGYGGCGGLCTKGARDIRAWLTLGTHRFIVCHDADSNPPQTVRKKVLEKIIGPCGSEARYCIAVPVREIEAWLIADEAAIRQAIPTFKVSAHRQPESIEDPKKWLRDASWKGRSSPLYTHAVHNAKVADHLRLDVVARKCPSFRTFLECLDQNMR